MNIRTQCKTALTDVHYRKLNNWAAKGNRLNEKQALEIMSGHVIGIDANKLAILRPYLVRLSKGTKPTHDNFYLSSWIYNGGKNLFWIPFVSKYSNRIYALGFDVEELFRTVLLDGYDSCPEVVIMLTSEIHILITHSILIGKTREETRISAINKLTKLMQKYG